MEERQKSTFPKNFFTQPRPHAAQKEIRENSIPFKWSESVLTGKSKVKIVSINK